MLEQNGKYFWVLDYIAVTGKIDGNVQIIGKTKMENRR